MSLDIDDVWDLNQDDLASERAVATQSIGKLEHAFINSGYKYGVDASKGDHMQDGFDEGFELSMRYGRSLGELLGALVAQREISKKLGAPSENIDALVMRLRAMKHTAAIRGVFTKNNIVSQDDRQPTEAYAKLIKEAEDMLARSL
ncbi:hypothetical protein GGI07_004317 [Coemansia sp. Benny D115]|nr:hypothetical protein GGI07_004317 [Coemansia sp. Benny D115]